MEAILTTIFGQAMQRTSIVGSILTVILVGLVILLFTFMKNRIAIMHQEAEHKTQLRDREFETKAAEQASLRAELTESRNYLIEQLRLDRKEKNRITRTLGSLCAETRAQAGVMKSLKVSIDAHCAESRARSEAIKEEILKIRRST